MTVNVTYTLKGGGPGTGGADLGEGISIINASGAELDNVKFFQYSNFNLLGIPQGDVIEFPYPNTVEQWKNGATESLEETVTSPTPSYYEASFADVHTPPNTLDKLEGNAPVTLSDTPSIGSTLGPGDMCWGFEWDANLTASGLGSELDISKDKRLSGITPVPEPSTFALAFAGLLAIAGFAFRRR